MKKFVYTFVMIILMGVFSFSVYKIYSIQKEYIEGANTYDDFSNEFVNDNGEGNSASNNEESEVPVQVDFDKLKASNPDVIGWIYNAGTVIDYPVVQGSDNEYYLHHLITGKYKSSGTPFLDINMKKDFSEKNNIIYAHHMKNGSMFSSITKYKDINFYNEHKNMYLMTPDNNFRLEVFSAYITPADSDTYMRGFGEDEEFTNYIKKITDLSLIKTDVNVTNKDNIISLSTCSYEYENARFIVHCKAVKIK